MEKKSFDLLTAAERGATLADGPEVRALEKIGLLRQGRITPAGLQALEPYRARRAVLIAAGQGSRLRPVTECTPKPLVRVGGKRIIDTLLDGLAAVGIREIYVVCGYLGEQFAELLAEYPDLQLIRNPLYAETNNIVSVLLAREHLQNAYVLEADLLVHDPGIFDKYLYHSCYLGIPTERTDDWYFKTDSLGVIRELGVGGEDCYRMLGISYWDAADGARLPAHIEAVASTRTGAKEDWCYVPLVRFREMYRVFARPCAPDAVTEIDTFGELCALDAAYTQSGQEQTETGGF